MIPKVFDSSSSSHPLTRTRALSPPASSPCLSLPWKAEFLEFFDPGLVHDAPMRNHLHATAIKEQQKVIKEGREWGTLEDWRRHARAKGWSAKRDLYNSMKQVDHDRQLRAAAFDRLREMQQKVSLTMLCRVVLIVLA
jgi:hypothetical protein